MLKPKDMIISIENFLDALINTRYLDEQEMWEYLRAFAEMKCNRHRALDPDRNR